MTRLPTLLLIAFTAALGGCDTTIDVDDYERSCSQDTECVPIFVGDVCSCSCDAGAINRSDLDRYNDDRDVDCDAQCGACAAVEAICQEGICEVTDGA